MKIIRVIKVGKFVPNSRPFPKQKSLEQQDALSVKTENLKKDISATNKEKGKSSSRVGSYSWHDEKNEMLRRRREQRESEGERLVGQLATLALVGTAGQEFLARREAISEENERKKKEMAEYQGYSYQ